MQGPPFRIISVCNGGGYRYARTSPPHPRQNANGLYPLHRVLAENKIGRLLTDAEVVHHRDGNTTNDAVDNLDVLDLATHARLHGLERGADVETSCGHCGERFTLPRAAYRLRLNRNKSGSLYCSRACGAAAQHLKVSLCAVVQLESTTPS